MLRRLLWCLLLLGQRLLQPRAFPGVMLPVQQLLLIDEFGALSVDQLLPEVFVLQQLQHVEAVRVPAGGVGSEHLDHPLRGREEEKLQKLEELEESLDKEHK